MNAAKCSFDQGEANYNKFCPASAVTAQSNIFRVPITNNISEDSNILGCNIVSMG